MLENSFTHTINAVSNELNRHADRLLRREFRLTYSQFVLLMNVREQGSVSVGELADLLHISQPAVSKKLSWFVGMHLIVLGRDEADKKRVMISATSRGTKLADEASQLLETSFRNAMNKFHEHDVSNLNSELLHILKILMEKDPMKEEPWNE